MRRVLASLAIWVASSRVGEMHKTEISLPLPGLNDLGLCTSFSMEGTRKPMVLPVPVLALAMTSVPWRMVGIVAAWTSVRCVNLRTSVMALSVGGDNWDMPLNDTSVRCFILEVV